MDVERPVSGAVSTPPAAADASPIFIKAAPFLTRLGYALKTWTAKIIVTVVLRASRIFRPKKFRAIAPTYTKRYPVRPMLENRVFLPKSYVSGSKLPLYIDIHGGGFILCDPATDDHFCHHFSNEYGYCVVSINYRKAPSHPFPVGVHDCAELARAVLADAELPADKEKVVIGGFSAGANLALSVAQFDDLKHNFRGVVPIYPPTDFSRRYRGQYKTSADGKEDALKRASDTFGWAYVDPNTDRRNTLLSSVYATREQLPQKMFLIGCQYDVLCDEANVLAKSLAGIYGEPDLGSEWTRNGIRWEMVLNQRHGFTHQELDGEAEIARQQVCKELYQRIDSWIKHEVWSK